MNVHIIHGKVGGGGGRGSFVCTLASIQGVGSLQNCMETVGPLGLQCTYLFFDPLHKSPV